MPDRLHELMEGVRAASLLGVIIHQTLPRRCERVEIGNSFWYALIGGLPKQFAVLLRLGQT